MQTQNQKELVSPKQKDGLFSKKGDSIVMTTTTEPIVIDGPCNDLIVLPPPPKP